MVRQAVHESSTAWTLPAEVSSGRTSLAIEDTWRLQQAGVTFVTDIHEGTWAICGTLPQALDKAVAQLHEEVDIDLIKQRLGAALVQAFTVKGTDRKLDAIVAAAFVATTTV